MLVVSSIPNSLCELGILSIISARLGLTSLIFLNEGALVNDTPSNSEFLSLLTFSCASQTLPHYTSVAAAHLICSDLG